MKTDQLSEERQYARVARIFPKVNLNAPTARVRALANNQVQK